MHRIKRDVPGALLVALVITVLPGLPRSAAAGGTRTLAPSLAAARRQTGVLKQAGLSRGRITEFALPGAVSPVDKSANSITRGADGNLWFSYQHSGHLEGGIGRITPRGTITLFAFPTAQSNCDNFGCSDPISSITAGPDGNLWFTETEGNKIGRITPRGTITEFALPPRSGDLLSARLDGITTGSDGTLWFTEFDGNKIGRLVP